MEQEESPPEVRRPREARARPQAGTRVVTVACESLVVGKGGQQARCILTLSLKE